MAKRHGNLRSPTVVAALLAVIRLLFPSLVCYADKASAKFDRLAELPRIYLKTDLADTPAPGKVHTIKAGDNLQAALDQAACGDILSLEVGATFSGRFLLPRKNCNDSHWIILRTSAADSDLPAEGSRLTPCYAGVASLPGRPDFHCGSAKNILARLVFAGKAGSGPIVLAAGANHYRLEGLEITRADNENSITALIGPEARAPADHIVLDRLWIHGTAQGETTRGLFLTGMASVAVVDSYFSDFHCISGTGSCTDAQAIGGGGGGLPSGPYKIVNNFLEASGENILFGGGPATITPADIEIRHNHFFKPLIWKPGQPGFVGGSSGKPFIVKNLFELKNAQRVLFEGNILDNSWGGVGQTGFALVLTPRNQNSQCPLCRVTDITLRNSIIRHMGSGMSIANDASDTGAIAAAGQRYSIHDLIFDDIDADAYKGFGAFAMILSHAPPIQDVAIDHITAFPSRVAIIVGADRERPLPSNFSITNSILGAGERDVTSAGGGPTNCAFGVVQAGPEAIFQNCFHGMNFTHNAIVGSSKLWPKQNTYLKNEEAVGFVNGNHERDANYRLCAVKDQPPGCKKASALRHAASDGRDLGADFDAVESATARVE
jgi:hypothetical protein